MRERKKDYPKVLGIDIGGSHITAGLVDLNEKGIVENSMVRKRVNRHAAAEQILDIWAGTINELEQKFPQAFSQVGFAMPGPFNYEEAICLIKGFDKYESLYGMNIGTELASRTGLAPEAFLFRNDADAFLEGEMVCGAGQGFTKALGLTLGTGLGSCLYNHGEISDAGLNVLPYKDGKAEDYISSRWFEQAYVGRTGKIINGVKMLADNFHEDAVSKVIFEEFGRNLAEVLLHAIHTFNPEAIIIGGNISNAFHLFSNLVEQSLKEKGRNVPIVQAVLGEDAPLIGAAISFKRKLAYIGSDFS